MLKIRLRRIGAIRQPHYRIVVADARAPRDGAFIETLGHYNPRTHPATIQVDVGKYEEWKHKGAQPTEAVERLVRQFNRAARKAAEAGEAASEGSAASRRTRTASGKGVSRPAPVAEPESLADAPMVEAAGDVALNRTDEPVLEAATETPAGAAEGAADTDTAT
jgi:small subunit ribosomal protein S16